MKFDDLLEDEISNFYKLISSNVKRIRLEKNMTQLDLALAIGHKSAALIAKAETDTYDKHFNIEHLYRISKILDIDICEFLKSNT